MKTLVRNITIKFVAYLMIGLMAMLIANKVMFTHLHKNAEGTILIHAHPYDKTNDSGPFKSHNHTQAEFLFFENLGILFLAVIMILVLHKFPSKAKYLVFIVTNYSLSCVILQKGRAPPVYNIIF